LRFTISRQWNLVQQPAAASCLPGGPWAGIAAGPSAAVQEWPMSLLISATWDTLSGNSQRPVAMSCPARRVRPRNEPHKRLRWRGLESAYPDAVLFCGRNFEKPFQPPISAAGGSRCGCDLAESAGYLMHRCRPGDVAASGRPAGSGCTVRCAAAAGSADEARRRRVGRYRHSPTRRRWWTGLAPLRLPPPSWTTGATPPDSASRKRSPAQRMDCRHSVRPLTPLRPLRREDVDSDEDDNGGTFGTPPKEDETDEEGRGSNDDPPLWLRTEASVAAVARWALRLRMTREAGQRGRWRSARMTPRSRQRRQLRAGPGPHSRASSVPKLSARCRQKPDAPSWNSVLAAAA
uniref:DUF4757 domain-containing protein n=1 Tax=Macrostomum lignano TaxID=282301 RepID=A0A1I8FJJ0_9PLAT